MYKIITKVICIILFIDNIVNTYSMKYDIKYSSLKYQNRIIISFNWRD